METNLTARQLASNHRAASHNNLKYSFGDEFTPDPQRMAQQQVPMEVAPPPPGGSRRARATRSAPEAEGDPDIRNALRELKEYAAILEKFAHLRSQSESTDPYRGYLVTPINVLTQMAADSAYKMYLRAETKGLTSSLRMIPWKNEPVMPVDDSDTGAQHGEEDEEAQ